MLLFLLIYWQVMLLPPTVLKRKYSWYWSHIMASSVRSPSKIGDKWRRCLTLAKPRPTYSAIISYTPSLFALIIVINASDVLYTISRRIQTVVFILSTRSLETRPCSACICTITAFYGIPGTTSWFARPFRKLQMSCHLLKNFKRKN